MKLLLDENLPRRLKADLQDYDVKTVPECGWAGLKGTSKERTSPK